MQFFEGKLRQMTPPERQQFEDALEKNQLHSITEVEWLLDKFLGNREYQQIKTEDDIPKMPDKIHPKFNNLDSNYGIKQRGGYMFCCADFLLITEEEGEDYTAYRCEGGNHRYLVRKEKKKIEKKPEIKITLDCNGEPTLAHDQVLS